MASSPLAAAPPDLGLLDSFSGDAFAGTPRADRAAALGEMTRPGVPTAINRYWRIDFSRLDLHLAQWRELVWPNYALPRALAERGVVFCDLAEAARTRPELLRDRFNRLVPAAETRFTAIAGAFEQGGYLLFVPAGVHIDEPLRVRVDLPAGGAHYPRNVIVLGEGAEATLLEEIHGAAAGADMPQTLLCGTAEAYLGRGAVLRATTEQYADPGAAVFYLRRASTEEDAHVHWAVAELGGSIIQSRLEARLDGQRAEADLTALFFSYGRQHVDLTGETVHRVGYTTSRTVVKGAACEHGQGRFAGNIRIERGAHGSSASLRDDALLLSPDSHIDAIPALEIAANDVQAFHGATVGAIDRESLFYLMSRGIPEAEAERIIALAFFDRAVANFGTAESRERVNETLSGRIGSSLV